MMTDDDIVRIAHLVHAVDAGANPVSDLAQALDQPMDNSDCVAFAMANKLIGGGSCVVSTDDQAKVGRARAIALLVGGTVASVDEHDGRTTILFEPPHRQ